MFNISSNFFDNVILNKPDSIKTITYITEINL